MDSLIGLGVYLTMVTELKTRFNSDDFPNKNVLINKINEYIDLSQKSIKSGDRENAIKYRNDVIDLFELKRDLFKLTGNERRTLFLLKTLQNKENNSTFKNKLTNLIKKRA